MKRHRLKNFVPAALPWVVRWLVGRMSVMFTGARTGRGASETGADTDLLLTRRVERGNVVTGGATDDADAPLSEEKYMSAIERPPAIVCWTLRLEEATALDRPVRALEPSIRSAFGTGRRASVLRGEWLGHAIHPLLTDVVLGTWTSATLLDLFGGRRSSAAAQRLVGAGLLAVAPTAWAGWAEWSAAGPREKRVGLVHAVTNAVAISVYAASWTARRNGRHRAGARLALAGATVSGVGAYLGGHLTEARKVSSRHPAYDNAPSETQAGTPSGPATT